jgi:hypothetical protein
MVAEERCRYPMPRARSRAIILGFVLVLGAAAVVTGVAGYYLGNWVISLL